MENIITFIVAVGLIISFLCLPKTEKNNVHKR